LKFWPQFNDENLISHADDRIRQEGRSTTVLSSSASSESPHETTGHPIGNSIESYQGFETVEVWLRQIDLSPPDAEGNTTVTDIESTDIPTGKWTQLYTEQKIEKLKIVEWQTKGSSTWQLQFRFRTVLASANYVSVYQFAHVAWHDTCG